MHILFICNEYPPALLVGGIGIFVKNISGALVKGGNRVTVLGLYTQSHDTEETDENGVQIIRIAKKDNPLKLGWYLNRRRLFLKLVELKNQFPISIIETSDYDAGFFMMPKIKIPKVVRLNGGETYFRTLLKEKLKWKYKFFESQSIKKADAISSVSNYTWIKTNEIFDFPPGSKPVILQNPVDATSFSPTINGVITGRIVYSGTFIRKKGVVDLFKALPIVFDKIPGAHIVCVGQDSRDSTTGSSSTQEMVLKELPERHHHKVTFTGKLPHDQVVDFLHSAQVCVYPSYLEAFPNAWVEAMACGKPIVASTTGSGAEVIEDEVSGLLCHPSDYTGMAERIIRILNDEDLANNLGKAARERVVNNFSMDVMLKKNIEWYQSVIATVNKK